MDFYTELFRELQTQQTWNRVQLDRLKCRLSNKHKLERIPSDAEILATLKNRSGMVSNYHKLFKLFRRKPMRTISGAAHIAVMTSPARCPHGRCIYCPGGVETGSAQSYTGLEPAGLRASQNAFDPLRQVKARLEQFETIGHPVAKIELIIMGGTFPARAIEYQTWFIKSCFEALNECKSESLQEALKLNEVARHRCTGLTIETRPDWCKESHVDRFLMYGATRVELGVQSLDDEVLMKVRRGHTVEDTIKATRILKDAGFKVCYHMMPGLPDWSLEHELEMFQQLFSNPDFRPDMLKIYPTLVLQDTELYDLWQQKKYQPFELESAIKLLSEIKPKLPPWVRIQRIQRDIPSYLIQAGVKTSNLRQLVLKKLANEGKRCNCIRCREVGLLQTSSSSNDVKYNSKHHHHQQQCQQRQEQQRQPTATITITTAPTEIKLFVDSYEGSNGTDLLLSYENNDRTVLIGYLRLRLPSEAMHRPELKSVRGDNAAVAIIRELKVVGQALELDDNEKDRQQQQEALYDTETIWQHRGYGRMLLAEAERIARERFDTDKLYVLSGVGVKPYFRKLGYKDDGVVYLSKRLKGL